MKHMILETYPMSEYGERTYLTIMVNDQFTKDIQEQIKSFFANDANQFMGEKIDSFTVSSLEGCYVSAYESAENAFSGLINAIIGADVLHTEEDYEWSMSDFIINKVGVFWHSIGKHSSDSIDTIIVSAEDGEFANNPMTYADLKEQDVNVKKMIKKAIVLAKDKGVLTEEAELTLNNLFTETN
jgi:hypothetical protein